MKRPPPERYNNRVIYLATRAVSLPFELMRATYLGAAALLQSLKSPQRRRAEDQRRQTRVRRGLRGLTQDHVQDPAKPS